MLHERERERESAKIMSGAMYKIYNLIVDHDFKKDLKNDVQISIYALILTEIEKKKTNLKSEMQELTNWGCRLLIGF